jgi:hypothetical protein
MSEQPNENGVIDIAPPPPVQASIDIGDFASPTKQGKRDYEYLLREMGEPSEDLRYAAQRWQSEDYRRIQGSLSGGSPTGDIKQLIDILDDAMQPLGFDEMDLLYRGQTEGLSQLRIGDKFKSKLFQATTTDPITAAGFSKSSGSVVGGIRTGESATILRIDAFGAKGLVIPGSSEFEVILARGTTFEVEDITEEIIKGVKMTIIDVFAVTP